MEALVIFLFVVNNIIWMTFLYIMTPHQPARSVRLPKISLKEIVKDIVPKKSKKPDSTVDIMNASEDDIKEINEALLKGMNNG